MRARGLDISGVQAHCDFQKVAAAGYDFIIPKATQGAKGRDAFFKEHIEGARAAGLLVPVVYHVLTYETSVDQQIGNCLDAALTYDVDVCVDFEVPNISLTPGQKTMRCLAFADGITACKRKCVVYSYPNYMRQLRGSAALVLLAQTAEYWGADYPDQEGPNTPWPAETANPWVPEAWGGRWAFWQFSGNGGAGAPGVPSIVDHNVYNGTREDLITWMRGTPKAETFSNPSQS